LSETFHGNVHRHIFQFAAVVAEDLSLSVVTEKLKSAFDDVKHFCDSHELKINLEKTQLILFKKPGKPIPEDFHIILDNSTVRYTSENGETSGSYLGSASHIWTTY